MMFGSRAVFGPTTALFCTFCAADPSVVTVPGFGTLHGVVTGNVRFFGGVPYAEPPLGDMRFRPPKLLTELPGSNASFDATEFGVNCLQPNAW
jgi:carboxylesterase type B